MAIRKEDVFPIKGTYKDYCKLCMEDELHDYEFDNGKIYMFSRGSRKHMLLKSCFLVLLSACIYDTNCIVVPEDSICINNVERTPDVSVKCTEKDNEDIKLVIEIVSTGTVVNDYNVKKDWYNEIGVEEYIIADTAHRALTVYNRDSDCEPILYVDGDTFMSSVIKDFKFEVSKAFDVNMNYFNKLGYLVNHRKFLED